MVEKGFKNPSEEFAYKICQNTFLSLWSYQNPQIPIKGKELCDVLVVCDPYIIIFSVKDIKVPDGPPTEIEYERWGRKAIEESAKQIYGAEKTLRRMNHVIRANGSLGINLPQKRKIHRVAIALGDKKKGYIRSTDFGKGYVHVFGESSFESILGELDTISDFIEYLDEKINLPRLVILHGGEEDLLAYYLKNNRSFPRVDGFLDVENGIWQELKERDEFKGKKVADAISKLWDHYIEVTSENSVKGTLELGSSLTNTEKALRVMAMENRFNRRLLSDSLLEIIKEDSKVESRIVISPSGIPYVFLVKPVDFNRELRTTELGIRCHVVRDKLSDKTTVVGIATEKQNNRGGFSLDLYYLYQETWSDDNRKLVEKMNENLNYFSNPSIYRLDTQEYPDTNDINKNV